ncbi:MAG TPA: hypothetical protein VFQ57_01780 [Sphingomonas sp.]|jgi:hypothetical protein|nr:hypothetical protein [Sphingomonas sp.]
MAEYPRTTTARDTDDHDLIDAAIADADTQIVGSGGGVSLSGDIGTQNDLVRAVADPAAMTRPMKGDDIAHDQAYDKQRDAESSGRS